LAIRLPIQFVYSNIPDAFISPLNSGPISPAWLADWQKETQFRRNSIRLNQDNPKILLIKVQPFTRTPTIVYPSDFQFNRVLYYSSVSRKAFGTKSLFLHPNEKNN
jgi:hypothetical protein